MFMYVYVIVDYYNQFMWISICIYMYVMCIYICMCIWKLRKSELPDMENNKSVGFRGRFCCIYFCRFICTYVCIC